MRHAIPQGGLRTPRLPHAYPNRFACLSACMLPPLPSALPAPPPPASEATSGKCVPTTRPGASCETAPQPPAPAQPAAIVSCGINIPLRFMNKGERERERERGREREREKGRFKAWHQQGQQCVQVHWECKQDLFKFFTDKLNSHREAKRPGQTDMILHKLSKRARY